MSGDSRARFDAGAEAWANYNQEPLGRIRRAVTWHNLKPYLPEITNADDAPRVLDAGGGSGEVALLLALRGYRVWLLDYAPAMLDQARQAAQQLPAEVQARLTFCLAAADSAGDSFGTGFFDAIACHTLIEYLPAPHKTLQTLVGTLQEGGLLSLSFVNHHAEVLRRVWSRGDPTGALASLEAGGFCAKLFHVAGRAYTSEKIATWLTGMGLEVTAEYGVRAFADFVPRHRLDEPEFFEAMVRLEKAVAHRPPYSLQARYVHLLAHKKMKPAQ
jgi:S-adenosylmethionine-dependent methyltransferase